MATFLDLASDALQSIGQVGIGQSLSPEQTQQTLRVANRMLAEWSIQRLMLYYVATRQFALSAGVQDYTIGPAGATFLGSRPVYVEAGQARIPGTSMMNPFNMLTKSEWDAIPDLGVICGTNGVPSNLWPDYTYPNLTFHVSPIPSTAVTISLATWEILQQFVNIFDSIVLPPGYETALTKNLAVEMANYYDMPVSDSLGQLAAKSLVDIQANNAQKLGGSLGESQNLVSPNVGNPVPTGQ